MKMLRCLALFLGAYAAGFMILNLIIGDPIFADMEIVFGVGVGFVVGWSFREIAA